MDIVSVSAPLSDRLCDFLRLSSIATMTTMTSVIMRPMTISNADFSFLDGHRPICCTSKGCAFRQTAFGCLHHHDCSATALILLAANLGLAGVRVSTLPAP